MAIKTWAQLSGNECVAHAEVANAVATGQLLWRGSNPGLAAGYCYTRSDFETYIQHSDMSASGIASNELMSKAEMETYRVLVVVSASIDSAETQWVSIGNSFQGRAWFSVSGMVNSVVVAVSVDGGSYQTVETLNVTPGSSGNVTSWVPDSVNAVPVGSTLQIRITPYTGANGTGTAGSPVSTEPLTEPV